MRGHEWRSILRQAADTLLDGGDGYGTDEQLKALFDIADAFREIHQVKTWFFNENGIGILWDDKTVTYFVDENWIQRDFEMWIFPDESTYLLWEADSDVVKAEDELTRAEHRVRACVKELAEAKDRFAAVEKAMTKLLGEEWEDWRANGYPDDKFFQENARGVKFVDNINNGVVSEVYWSDGSKSVASPDVPRRADGSIGFVHTAVRP